MLKYSTLSVFAAAMTAVAGSALADEFRAYHVGNSLTEDLIGYTLDTGFRKVAWDYEVAKGNTYTWGDHIKHGESLTYIHDNPTVTDFQCLNADHGTWITDERARWTAALPGYHWDAVTLEPYPGTSATLTTDTAVINDMIKETRKGPNNANTQVYIYAAWPAVVTVDVSSNSKAYHAATSNTDDQADVVTHDYWRFLADRVRQTNPGVSVIPVGEVFDVLDGMMQAGKFDGLHSALDLHRDNWHTNSVGMNIAAWTAFATIYKQSPEGKDYLYTPPTSLTVADGYSNPATMTEHDRQLIQQTIWNVVKDNSAYTSVPEPASLAVIGLGTTVLLRRRRKEPCH